MKHQAKLCGTPKVLGLLLLATLAFFAASANASAAISVSMGEAKNPGYTTVEVSGQVDPGGGAVYTSFQFSKDGGAHWTNFNFGGYYEGGPQPVTLRTEGGLLAGTEYEVRLAAVDFNEHLPDSSEAISTPPNPKFKTKFVAHPTVTLADPVVTSTTTAHFEGTIDPESIPEQPEAYDVEWHFECTPECPDLVGGTIKADDVVHTVKADAIDLKPGTKYQVKLVATNGAGPTVAGPKQLNQPVIPPTLRISPAHVSATSASLTGTVNPNGSEANYHFEYGPDFSRSTPSKIVFAGNAPVAVKAVLSDLTPGTVYPYRLVATNSAGESKTEDRTLTTRTVVADECPNAAFRFGPSALLPDCRAYELVNPPGLDFGDLARVPTVSEDGTKLSYMTLVAPDIANSALILVSFTAERTADGWVTKDANAKTGLLPATQLSAGIACYSEDYTKGMVWTTGQFDDFDRDNGFLDIYELAVGTGETKWISFGQPDTLYNSAGFVTFYGASPDLSRIIFSDIGGERLTPDTPETYYAGLYARDADGIELISILPNGKPAETGPTAVGFGTNRWGNCGRPTHSSRFGVSADASKVFFFDSPTYNGVLYRRDLEAKESILISASQRAGKVGEPSGVSFVSATPDGETVYFESGDQMTDKSSPGGGLYRYEVATDTLEQITPDTKDPVFGIQAGYFPSEDGSHIYFGSPRRFTPDAQRNANNLYVWRDDNSGDIQSPEGPSAGSVELVASVTDGGWEQRITPDGRYALIQSRNSIDGAANNGKNTIYLYDDETGEIACVSCRPNGTPSARDSNLADGPESLSPPDFIVPRNLTLDGRVFFNSSDRLLAADQTFSQDVYGYDDGRVTLYTSGQGEENQSYLADVSDDGKHVLFLTRTAFLPQDRDPHELDLYDANALGGLPSPKPTPPICEGEACRTATSPIPPEALPTTPNFSGAPNPRVKREKEKKHHKKKHHKKKHHKKKSGKKKGGRR